MLSNANLPDRPRVVILTSLNLDWQSVILYVSIDWRSHAVGQCDGHTFVEIFPFASKGLCSSLSTKYKEALIDIGVVLSVEHKEDKDECKTTGRRTSEVILPDKNTVLASHPECCHHTKT